MGEKKTGLGRARMEWARVHQRIMNEICRDFSAKRPFEGLTIGVCLHVEPKTAVLCSVLAEGGASIALTGSPGTTQDDVAEALAADGIAVYGRRADGRSEHAGNIRSVVSHDPDIVLDNGADLVAAVLASESAHRRLRGGTEETTTGANRLREDFARELDFPVIVINDSPLKSIVENQFGVGQGVVEAFMHATNLMVPAKHFVVIGYGFCGRGIARSLRSFGARVVVVEVDEVRALEAVLDGMEVRDLEEVLTWGEVFVTVTGRAGILRRAHFERMRDGAVLLNAGHFSWEIDVESLRTLSVETETFSTDIEGFRMASGRSIYLLARGEMINLAASGGNPIETMDLGLALQARSLARIATRGDELSPGPLPVPDDINREVARQMLAALS
jgi:adenosylhomocysteinase